MRAWAEIDLSALAHNFRALKERAGGRPVLAAVKADAYGHGAVAVSKALVELGAERFAVATPNEALELRRAGIGLPVHILGAVLPEEAGGVAGRDFVFTVSTLEEAQLISAAAQRPERVHVEIDTGMGRSGARPEEAPALAAAVAGLPRINIEGAMTHFPCADVPGDETCARALEMFLRAVEEIRARGISVELLHAANSAATTLFDEAHLDMIRPGLALYGMTGAEHVARALELRPVMSVRARAVLVRRLPAGTPVGYGSEWRAEGPSAVAAVSFGYADGFCRRYARDGYVLVRGERRKVIGRASMDVITVDVTGLGAKRGDEVVILGSQGEETITAEDIARWGGTIPYEVTCLIGRRVERVCRGSVA